jgi:hypothetical protein
MCLTDHDFCLHYLYTELFMTNSPVDLRAILFMFEECRLLGCGAV